MTTSITYIPVLSFLASAKWGHHAAAPSHVKAAYEESHYSQREKKPKPTKKQKGQTLRGKPLERKNVVLKFPLAKQGTSRTAFCGKLKVPDSGGR